MLLFKFKNELFTIFYDENENYKDITCGKDIVEFDPWNKIVKTNNFIIYNCNTSIIGSGCNNADNCDEYTEYKCKIT